MKLIGLCGYAQSGKDSAASTMKGWYRAAFADHLKKDLHPLLQMVGCDVSNPAHKAIARGLLVEWGRTARAFKPAFWIDRLFSGLRENGKIVITDVRYANEIRAIVDRGGIVVRILRPGYGPANEEEALSFKAIEAKFHLPIIRNNGTLQSLGKRVLEVAKSLGIEE